jgi:SAM-dependent methyltransferase
VSELYDPELYDASVGELPGEIDFYVRLAREAHEAGHPVLELACGTGRVALAVARAGVSIVGLDVSPAMLTRAREKASALTNARWVEGDIRSFALEERFGLVTIPIRSFQHLLTTDDQFSCLRCIREHLVQGGRLALHIFNPDIVRMAQWNTARRGTFQRYREYQHPRSGNRIVASESVVYRTAAQELDATYANDEIDGRGAVVSTVYRGMTLRYTYRYEMEHLLARSGFEVEALYGDFEGGPLCNTSVEMVWLARRPAE